jgi:hypothetical protein
MELSYYLNLFSTTVYHTKFGVLHLIKPGTKYISGVLCQMEDISIFFFKVIYSCVCLDAILVKFYINLHNMQCPGILTLCNVEFVHKSYIKCNLSSQSPIKYTILYVLFVHAQNKM